MGVGKLLLVKCSQALSNWIKKFSLFCFCKFLCLLDLKICFCLKRARPWLESRIKFYGYSMRSFERALVVFNNLWIHFTFREFNLVSMSKKPILPFQMESWAKCQGGCIFFPFKRKSYIILVSFLIYFEIVYIWLIYHSLDKSIWFTIDFLPLKESLTLF